MWQSYFEMMHVVPSCASPVPYFSPSYSPESYSPESPPDLTFEFDLNLLPSSDCADVVPGLDLPLPIPTDPFQEVPSPSSSFTFLDSSLHSPTMFSPVGGGNEKTPLYSSYMMDPNSSSPISLPPSSPYSPVGRPNRLSSTDSGRLTEGSSVSSIQDSLMELNELRSHFRMDQVVSTSSPVTIPPPPYHVAQGLLVPKTEPQSSNDHPLLRQVLEDYSFESKFEANFGSDSDFRSEVKSELDDSLSEVKMNPVISLAMEQVKKDIDTTCQILHISPDPSRWSRNDVVRWLEWTMQQFNILPARSVQEWATDGQGLVQLTETQFKEKFPQGGDLMYSQLDVWRSTANCSQQEQVAVVPQQQQQQQQQHSDLSMIQSGSGQFDPRMNLIDLISIVEDNNENRSFESGSRSYDPSQQHLLEPPPAYPGTPLDDLNTDFSMEDDDDEISSEQEMPLPSVVLASSPTPQTPPTPNRSSSNIHLWQFVKELLNEPHLHSGCIHWVDREKGIFKIVDSVRVAHLWGKRKNRPAMNYDKLSRSLRQYYKKGIMKKTERTQRLVYQFCPPYHL